MLYNSPTGAATANDPYVGKNTTAGTQGSKIPPAAVEFPQREIVAAIVESGQAPTNTDLKQLMRAVRSGGMNVLQDQGTPNAIVLAAITAHNEYRPGQPICIVLANTITGATTLKLDGLGILPVLYAGGTPLQRFDFLAGDLLVGRVNASGTSFIVLSPINQTILDTAVVKSVHGVGADFPDLNAAFNWLNRRRIAATGSVAFQLSAGVSANKTTYTQNIAFNHPDGGRVTIRGQPLSGSLPSGTALTISGSGSGARLSDTTTNLAILRNVYSTEVAFAGGAQFTGTGTLGNLQDILFTSDGTGSADNLFWSGGRLGLTRISSVGASFRGICAYASYISITGNCYALGSGNSGITAEGGGLISLINGAALISCSNAVHGVFANAASISAPSTAGATGTGTTHTRGNAGDGVGAVSNGSVTVPGTAVSNSNAGSGFCAIGSSSINASAANAGGNNYGFTADLGSVINATNTGGGNATYAYYATNGSTITRQGGTATGSVATASPVVGSAGNSNAYIA